MLKVVLVIDQFDDSNNGTTVTARRLAENLRAEGHTVTVLAGGAPGPDKVCAKKHRIPFFQRLIESQGMCFAKPDPKLYYEAFRDADVAHFFLPFRFCRQGEKHARQLRIPCVAAFHLQPENITSSLFLQRWRRVNDWLYRWFYKRFYNRFSMIHCPSSFIAEQLRQHGYAAEARVISNGVARAFTPREAQKPAEWQGKYIIMMTGRFSREKRQDLVIKAVKNCKYAEKIQLVFAGKGPHKHQYARLGKKLPNRPVFRFFSQPDLIRMINCCDLYVHASDAEIEGIGAMEAMACGIVPVISDSKLSATGQYALHEQCLFRAGDADDLARRIEYWVEHEDEKQALAQQYIRQQDGNRVDICTEKMVEMYREVILHPHRPVHDARPIGRLRRLFIPNPEKLTERLHAAKKHKAAFTHFWGSFIAALVLPFSKLFLGLRIRGRENIQNLPGGAITVCNHVHPMDCTMVKAGMMSRCFWLVSLRENFEIPVVGGLIKLLGAVPLGRGHREQAQMRQGLLERIQKGNVVHFYPEGMLVPYYQGVRKFHGGAFAMAVQGNCAVVPMAVRFEKRGGLYRLKRKPCLTLYILKPIFPNPDLPPKKAREELAQLCHFHMRRCIEGGRQAPERVRVVTSPVYGYEEGEEGEYAEETSWNNAAQ